MQKPRKENVFLVIGKHLVYEVLNFVSFSYLLPLFFLFFHPSFRPPFPFVRSVEPEKIPGEPKYTMSPQRVSHQESLIPSIKIHS